MDTVQKHIYSKQIGPGLYNIYISRRPSEMVDPGLWER
jgi:hypothetical protein